MSKVRPTLGEARQYGRWVVRRMREIPEPELVYKARVVGSVRREKPDPRDIDIVFSSPVWDEGDAPKRVIEHMKLVPVNACITRASFMLGGICVTLHATPMRGFGMGLICITGPPAFSKRVVARGQELGYKINPTMIYDADNPVPVANEREVFKLLGWDYVKPRERV